MDLPAALERRHAPPAGAGDTAAWREAFDVAFWTPRGTFGGHLTLLVGPGPRCCYWTSVLEEGRPVVTVVEHDVPVPRAPGGLEVRAQGLWADQNCEEPFVHWSYGLEAFALRVDRPEDAIGDGRGERVGLGYDLEWEAVPGEPPVPLVLPPGAAHVVPGGYRQPGRFHGEILVGADTYELDAAAVRSHWWGTQPWPGVDSGPQPPDEELVGRCLAEVPGDGVLERRLVRSAEVASLRTHRSASA
jgi:hypothetical protein